MKKPRWTMAVILCAVVAACGGNVVVDAGGSGGVGGAGGGSGTCDIASCPDPPFTGLQKCCTINGVCGLQSWPMGTCFPPGQGTGGGTSTCLSPPDPATLTFCGGTGSGPSPTCMTAYCDNQGNIYEAACEPTTCRCNLNNKTLCTCALNGPGNICGGTPHCCPFATVNGP